MFLESEEFVGCAGFQRLGRQFRIFNWGFILRSEIQQYMLPSTIQPHKSDT